MKSLQSFVVMQLETILTSADSSPGEFWVLRSLFSGIFVSFQGTSGTEQAGQSHSYQKYCCHQ